MARRSSSRSTPNPKDIIGSTKLPLHLWPSTATAHGCLGLLDGLLKYGRSNFRAVGVKASIYISAILRHALAYAEGEDVDPDSGLHPLDHLLASTAILIEAIEMGNLTDDRCYPLPNYREMINRLTSNVARLQVAYADRVPPRHYTIADARGEAGRSGSRPRARSSGRKSRSQRARQVDRPSRRGSRKARSTTG